MLSKAFLRERAYAISLTVAKDMILFYSASTLLSRWYNLYRAMTICVVFYTIRVISRNRDEKIAKAVKRDEIRSTYNKHKAYIEDKISLFQTTALGKTEAYQLCSSTIVLDSLGCLCQLSHVSRQCLMSKLRGEALYCSALQPASPDELNKIASKLRWQKGQILAAVGGYEIMASALDILDGQPEELEGAKKWVLYINARLL